MKLFETLGVVDALVLIGCLVLLVGIMREKIRPPEM